MNKESSTLPPWQCEHCQLSLPTLREHHLNLEQSTSTEATNKGGNTHIAGTTTTVQIICVNLSGIINQLRLTNLSNHFLT